MKRFRVRSLFEVLRNNRGETGGTGGSGEGGGGGGEGSGGSGGGVKFSAEQQAFVDNLIGRKYAEFKEGAKATESELAELRKFQADHKKATDAAEQKALEEQKEYGKVLEGKDGTIADLQTKLSEKDKALEGQSIKFALTREIINQGGYLEESLALLGGNATIRDGVVSITGVNENNVETNFNVAEGVKQFLEKKPHLKKASQNGGGGTGSGDAGGQGGTGGTGGAGGEDLESLNTALLQASNMKDFKKVEDIKGKIRANLKARGVSV